MAIRLQRLEDANAVLTKELAIVKMKLHKLKKAKACREIMYRLKDFDVFCHVAQKAIEGKELQPHEDMYLNGMMNKTQVTQKSLQGLFQRQNIDGHAFVTKNKVL